MCLYDITLWCLRYGLMCVYRQSSPVLEYQVHEDFVSGMTYSAENNTLLTVSGDSTLCVYDMRTAKGFIRSDEQESELTCIELIKGGRKVTRGNLFYPKHVTI